MSEGEVFDNVRPSNSLPQQEERNLQQLHTQGEQSAVENMRRFSLFFPPFPFGTEIGFPFDCTGSCILCLMILGPVPT